MLARVVVRDKGLMRLFSQIVASCTALGQWELARLNWVIIDGTPLISGPGLLVRPVVLA